MCSLYIYLLFLLILYMDHPMFLTCVVMTIKIHWHVYICLCLLFFKLAYVKKWNCLQLLNKSLFQHLMHRWTWIQLGLKRERIRKKLTCFIEEEGILILLHVLRGSGLIQEQRIDPFNVLNLNLRPLRKPKHTGELSTQKLETISSENTF